jgi:glutamate/aspartate transport system ATP-binding protein
MNSMIEINDISKWYGQFAVLTECSTHVREGEVVGSAWCSSASNSFRI